MQPTGNQYEIETINDMLALSDEQFSRMLIDLKHYREICNGMIRRAREMEAALHLPAGSIRVEVGNSFTWIDDGEHTGTINTKLETEDGEVLATSSETVQFKGE